MTSRPPRASTKGDGRRAKTRGATHGERERPSKRASTLGATDEFERIVEEAIVEVAELPAIPQLRMLVLETAAHLASAQGAIAAAGHVVVTGASGRDAIDKLRAAVGDVDALLVGLPGSEPLIDAALAHPRRPIVIAASTCSAGEAVRRAAAAGADLATTRPHDLERLAPILLGAARLSYLRRTSAPAPRASEEVLDVFDAADSGELDQGGLVTLAQLRDAATRELARAQTYGYALTVAMFGVELAPPAPAAVLRGIVRARCGNALVHALRDIDLATELDQDRFLVVMPLTERHAGADVARKILGAVAGREAVVAGGRTFPLKMIGAVVTAVAGAPALDALIADVTQLLEQAQISGASLAVET